MRPIKFIFKYPKLARVLYPCLMGRVCSRAKKHYICQRIQTLIFGTATQNAETRDVSLFHLSSGYDLHVYAREKIRKSNFKYLSETYPKKTIKLSSLGFGSRRDDFR